MVRELISQRALIGWVFTRYQQYVNKTEWTPFEYTLLFVLYAIFCCLTSVFSFAFAIYVGISKITAAVAFVEQQALISLEYSCRRRPVCQ